MTTLPPALASRLADLIVARTAIEREISDLLSGGTGMSDGASADASAAPTRPTWTCLRCGYPWHSIRDARPKHCARCHSSAWDRAPGEGSVLARRPGDPANPKWRGRGKRTWTMRAGRTGLPRVDAPILERSHVAPGWSLSRGLPPPPGLAPPAPTFAIPFRYQRPPDETDERGPEEIVGRNMSRVTAEVEAEAGRLFNERTEFERMTLEERAARQVEFDAAMSKPFGGMDDAMREPEQVEADTPASEVPDEVADIVADVGAGEGIASGQREAADVAAEGVPADIIDEPPATVIDVAAQLAEAEITPAPPDLGLSDPALESRIATELAKSREEFERSRGIVGAPDSEPTE